jgi:lysyl-tRNA synthetase class 2
MNMDNQNSYQDEYQIRLKRLSKIKQLGIEPYPSACVADIGIKQTLDDFESKIKNSAEIKLVGRIKSRRLHGGSCFVDLENNGEKIQLYFKKDVLSEKYEQFGDLFDVGDFISIIGTAMRTKVGEPSILVSDFSLLSKALLPLPEKWHGLKDIEIRFRKRYLDLIANDSVREIFLQRSKIITFLRNYLIESGFLEVETPILQAVASGAIAKPFKTHHSALDADMFLRIAPELYLKELLVGGFNQVFEVARCFRNEGIDTSHNPEFNQIEFYWAYKDYNFLMQYMEKLMSDLVQYIHGKLSIVYDKEEINFKPPYPRLDFRQALIDYCGIDLDKHNEVSLAKEAKLKGLIVEDFWGKGKLADEIYKTFVRPKLIQPTYLINHPIELSPLAKKIPNRPNYVERFQLIVAGKIELMNAFSELNDPIDQEERFKLQSGLATKGDSEAMSKDDLFVNALKHGLPPAAGLGIGIERLVMLLTNQQNIKEVILFPTLKPINIDEEI